MLVASLCTVLCSGMPSTENRSSPHLRLERAAGEAGREGKRDRRERRERGGEGYSVSSSSESMHLSLWTNS